MTRLLSMVVDDFHFRRAGTALGPLKADAPLVVDADAPLPPALALKPTITAHPVP